MGKKNLFVLALCLGAWVNPVVAQDSTPGLEAGFQKIFWNTSIRNFERKLVDQILQDHQEAITRLITEDGEGRALTQKIYAAATGDLLEADYRLNSRRQENSRRLGEGLLKTLTQLGRYYFREDVQAIPSSHVGYTGGSFHANAKLYLWTNFYGWSGVTRDNELTIEVRVSSEQITVCMETDRAGRECKPFSFDDDEMISDLQSPDGRHTSMPDDVAGSAPAPSSSEPEAKARFNESGSGF